MAYRLIVCTSPDSMIMRAASRGAATGKPFDPGSIMDYDEALVGWHGGIRPRAIHEFRKTGAGTEG